MKDFVRVAAVAPKVFLGDTQKNLNETLKCYREMAEQAVQIMVFPEMGLTGYGILDLVQNAGLLARAKQALLTVAEQTQAAIAIVGLPLQKDGRLFNCAAVLQNGRVLGVVPKCHLPEGKEFQESRWFTSGKKAIDNMIELDGRQIPFGLNMLFKTNNCQFAVEICEDLWTVSPPSCDYARMGADVIFNLSASNELAAKHDYRLKLIAQQSARTIAGYVYAGAGYGESTTDMVFAGYTGVFENGAALSEGKRFLRTGGKAVAEIDLQRLRYHRMQTGSFFDGETVPANSVLCDALPPFGELTLRKMKQLPFVPSELEQAQRCEEIVAIQVMALQTRMEKTHMQKLVIGVSGGLDSTLALLVATLVMDEMGLDRKNLIAITMPGFGTGTRTYQNAHRLMTALNVTAKEISIKEAVLQHFRDIGQDENKHDVTYENAQARERTQILMDLANKESALVLGTGDLSEGALGFSTYNGDHMSMYNINCSIPKTLMRTLTKHLADTAFEADAKAVLYDVLVTPVSPELLPVKDGELNQKTEEILGDYALHDFFLYHLMDSGSDADRLKLLAMHVFANVYDDETISNTLITFIRRFYTQQFKRSCTPDGPKVGSVSLSPRGDWRMPSDVDYTSFMPTTNKQ